MTPHCTCEHPRAAGLHQAAAGLIPVSTHQVDQTRAVNAPAPRQSPVSHCSSYRLHGRNNHHRSATPRGPLLRGRTDGYLIWKSRMRGENLSPQSLHQRCRRGRFLRRLSVTGCDAQITRAEIRWRTAAPLRHAQSLSLKSRRRNWRRACAATPTLMATRDVPTIPHITTCSAFPYIFRGPRLDCAPTRHPTCR